MLAAAVNVGAAEHDHPNEKILGKGLGNGAGGMEKISGDYLIADEHAHHAEGNGAKNLKDFVNDKFYFIKYSHGVASLWLFENGPQTCCGPL